MTNTQKPKRLSKVARELNVGISTLVDYLIDKGHEVDANPNTKIESNVYDLLLSAFQSEKVTKEQSKLAGLKKEERTTVAIEHSLDKERKREEAKKEKELVAEVVEPVVQEVIKANVENDVKVSVVGKINLDDLSKKSEDTIKEEVVEAAPEKEEIVEEKVVEAPVEEKKVVIVEEKIEEIQAEVVQEKKEVVEAAPEKEEVVEKHVTEEKEIKKEEKEVTAVVIEPISNVSPEISDNSSTTKMEEVKDKVGSSEPETIKANVKKLTGPTVVGKIELPTVPDKKKQNAAKAKAEAEKKKKRKRKRIKKVEPGSTVNAGSQANTGDRSRPQRPPFGNKKRGPSSRSQPAAKKTERTEEEIQKEIKETLARLSGGGKSKSAKFRRAKREMVSQKREEELKKQEEEKKVLKATEFVTVSELATMMDVETNEVISACMTLGIFASINQRLDAETLTIVADEFGYEIDFVSADVQENILVEEDAAEDLEERPPIVTVMGHVDHGKTSLLDYVRSANVIAGEAGGITQHIGAYKVKLQSGKYITFLDTPGHEAFTAMRARGAKVTDVAIIVVSADDDVMPQTKEAINHAQAADVPMIFAINKIDRPDANPDRIKEQLSGLGILVEEWGGKFQSQEISAKKGTNITELLDKVLLESELLELKANPNKRAVGTIIESALDKGRGYVCTILVEAGTLKVGDFILTGCFTGKIKAMHNERGQVIGEAGPATPVSVLGISGAPSAGDKFYVMDDEKEAKQIAVKRLQLQREQGIRTQKHVTLDEIGRRLAVGDFKELNVILKGDVDGSIEALSDSLQKLSTEQIQVNIIHKGVGQITESDVLLASASDAVIVGFQVRPSPSARKLSEKEQIEIRLYSIIYQAIEEIKAAMEGMLSPDIKEEILGTAEVRETFKITKVGTIAGCYVLEGKLKRNEKVRIIRDGIVIYTGDLGSLKRFKDDVKEVTHGYECGLNIDKFNDLREGDSVESFTNVEVKKTLA